MFLILRNMRWFNQNANLSLRVSLAIFHGDQAVPKIKIFRVCIVEMFCVLQEAACIGSQKVT